MIPERSKFKTPFLVVVSISLVIGICLFFALNGRNKSIDFDVSSLEIAASSDKLIVVLGDNRDSTALVYAYEKEGGEWKEQFKTTGFIGKGGVTYTANETVEETPAGVHSLLHPLGIADDPGSLMPYTKVTDKDVWVNDENSRYYNTFQSDDNPDKDWSSAERIVDEPVAYKYIIPYDYNINPTVKGMGSAFFLHCSKGKPTGGCVSVPDEYMVKILAFADENTKLVIASSIEDLMKN